MTTNDQHDEQNENDAEQPAEAATSVQPAVPDGTAQRVVDLKRPGWLTRSVAIAGGAAAAAFVVGGATGFAIGNGGGDDVSRGGFNGPPGMSRNSDGQQSFGGPGGPSNQGNPNGQDGQNGGGFSGQPGQGMPGASNS